MMTDNLHDAAALRVVALKNGNLLVPARVESADGIIGDGIQEIAPDHPDYERWLPFVCTVEGFSA